MLGILANFGTLSITNDNVVIMGLSCDLGISITSPFNNDFGYIFLNRSSFTRPAGLIELTNLFTQYQVTT
jgi:hypothetical protein